MKKNQKFLDVNERHTLTEQECELIGLFRTFNQTQRKVIFETLFFTALNKVHAKHKVQDGSTSVQDAVQD